MLYGYERGRVRRYVINGVGELRASEQRFGRILESTVKASHDLLNAAFRSVALRHGFDLQIVEDGAHPFGTVTVGRRPVDAKLWQLIALWSWTHTITAAKLIKPRPLRARPVQWVISAHPNVVMNRRMRLGLTHIASFMADGSEASERQQSIEAVLEDLLLYDLPSGARVGTIEYARLWLDTVGDNIWDIAEFLEPNQLWTWIGVDADGSGPDFINRDTIGQACREFMRWTLRRYRDALSPLRWVAPDQIRSIRLRLEATKAGRRTEWRPNSYGGPDEFISDLIALRRTAKGYDRLIDGLVLRAQVFGFTMLIFQPRINVASIWTALKVVVQAAGLPKLPSEEGQIARWIDARMEERGFMMPDLSAEIEGVDEDDRVIAAWVLSILEGLKIVQDRAGRLSQIVLASVRSPQDVLASRLLLRWAKIRGAEEIALLEDGAGLELAKPVAAVSSRTVMDGCSDSVRLLGAVAGWVYIARAAHVIQEQKKRVYMGRAMHPLRGGLFDPLQQSLWQGDDVWRMACTPEAARDFVRQGSGSAMLPPKVWLELAEPARTAFHSLVSRQSFNLLWAKVAPLVDLVGINPRPRNRGKTGGAAKRDTWEAGRAIGAVQSSEVLLCYFPHLFGAGPALLAKQRALQKLYAAECPFTVKIVGTLKCLLIRHDPEHLALVGRAELSEADLAEIRDDYGQLLKAIRSITGEPEWEPAPRPEWVQRARQQVCELVLKERSESEQMMLGSLMLALLSWAETSG